MKGMCACNHAYLNHAVKEQQPNQPCYAPGCICTSYKEITYPPRNPIFSKLLDELKELHEAKSHDYAADNNVYSNFEFAADFAGVTVNQVFDVLIGVKQARLLELISKGKEAKNESILDTLKDFVVYSALRASYYIKEKNKEATDAHLVDGHLGVP